MQRGRARWARRDRPSRRRTTTPVMPRAGATVAGPPRPLNSRESAGRAVVMATREPARRGLPWPPGGAATAAARSIILRSPSHDSSPPCLPPGRGRGPRPPAPPPPGLEQPQLRSPARSPRCPTAPLPLSHRDTLPSPREDPPPSSPSRPVPWTGEVSPLPPLRASPTGHPRLDQVVGGGPPGGGGRWPGPGVRVGTARPPPVPQGTGGAEKAKGGGGGYRERRGTQPGPASRPRGSAVTPLALPRSPPTHTLRDPPAGSAAWAEPKGA